MKANIKNVDGINERMVNLIKEFKNEQENNSCYLNRSLSHVNKKDENFRRNTESNSSTIVKPSRSQSIKNNKKNISPIEIAHRSCSACLVAHAAMKFDKRLHFDPIKEKFVGNEEANKLLSRPQRYPYGTSYVKVPKLITKKV